MKSQQSPYAVLRSKEFLTALIVNFYMDQFIRGISLLCICNANDARRLPKRD